MRRALVGLIIVVSLALLGGCGVIQTSSSDTPEAQASSPPPPLPVGAQPGSQGGTYYYYFDDILLPKDMELQPDDTFIMKVANQRSGVMVFSGRVEHISLANFFMNSMPQDGWNLVTSFESLRTILIYEKPTRYCVINITAERFDTLLEIWVAQRDSASPVLPMSRQSRDSMEAGPQHPDSEQQSGIFTEPPVMEQGLPQ